MKIASHVLFFNQDKWILKHIEMVAPFVDKIYVAWSAVPWTYNPAARMMFQNNSNPDFLKQSSYYDKIELIEGTWNLDEEQRNACLDAAKRDDMDYMLIIDADEFYFLNDIANIVNDIKNNPDYDVYNSKFTYYWKDFNHILTPRNASPIQDGVSVAINVKTNCRFIRCRGTNGSRLKQLPYVCWHGSYVLTDEECWSKINIWGHAHQFDVLGWFNNKWKNWTEETTDLHPIEPSAWYKAMPIPKETELPEVLK